LPIAHPALRCGEPVSQHAQSPTACRVLVVDDNADTADSLALLLNLWGHRACVAYDGPAALRVAEAYRPQVVLLDLGLPGRSGSEVARRLRKEPALEKPLLVAVTGPGPEDCERTWEAGFDLYLTKPVDLVVLRELLARRSQSPPPADATSR
jgi:DNA-binding response OmpR family regulator